MMFSSLKGMEEAPLKQSYVAHPSSTLALWDAPQVMFSSTMMLSSFKGMEARRETAMRSIEDSSKQVGVCERTHCSCSASAASRAGASWWACVSAPIAHAVPAQHQGQEQAGESVRARPLLMQCQRSIKGRSKLVGMCERPRGTHGAGVQ